MGGARRLGTAAVLQSGEQGSCSVGSSSLAAYIQVFGVEGAKRGLRVMQDARRPSIAVMLQSEGLVHRKVEARRLLAPRQMLQGAPLRPHSPSSFCFSQHLLAQSAVLLYGKGAVRLLTFTHLLQTKPCLCPNHPPSSMRSLQC